MSMTQPSERCPPDDVKPAAVLSETELAAETRCGEGLARALVEHLCPMHVAGYGNEILVDGETWVVAVKRSPPAR